MKFLDLSFDRLSALGYAPGYRVQQVQKARHSVETTRSKKAHPPACRARVEGEEMIQSEPKSASDLTVCARHHPSGGQIAVYRFSDIDGFHRGRVSDGVGRETSHDALFGYVMCDGAVSGTFVPPRASASPDQSLHPENLQQRRLESDRGCPEGEGEIRERFAGWRVLRTVPGRPGTHTADSSGEMKHRLFMVVLVIAIVLATTGWL